MGVCCQGNDQGRGLKKDDEAAASNLSVDTSKPLKHRGSIRPSVAHRDKKLVRDYTLGI